MEIARAIFAAVADAAVRAHEAPVDRERAAGVLAAYLTDVYTRAEFRYVEYFRELLSPIDFVPAVDQLMYAPLLASPSTYFGDVDDRDAIRDGVRPLRRRAGPARACSTTSCSIWSGPRASRRWRASCYVERTPLRRAAAELFGADLGWFWRAVAGRVAARELPPGHGARHAGRGRGARRHRRPARRRDDPRAGRGAR